MARYSFILTLFYFLFVGHVSAAERIVKQEYDCGIVLPGEKIHHAFKLVNSESRDLAVKKISKNCSCNGTSVSSHVIPVGQAIVLDVYFTAEYRDKPKIVEVIVEASDGKDIVKYWVNVKAESKNIIRVANGDRIVTINSVNSGIQQKKSITVPLNVLDAFFDHFHRWELDHSKSRTISEIKIRPHGNNLFDIDLFFSDDQMLSGIVRDSIDVNCYGEGNEIKYVWTQYFEINFKNDLNVHPRQIILGSIDDENITTCTLVLSSEDFTSGTLRVLGASATHLGVNYATKRRTNTSIEMDLSISAADIEKGAFEESLLIECCIGQQQFRLSIPVIGYMTSSIVHSNDASINVSEPFESVSLWKRGRKDESVAFIVGSSRSSTIAIEPALVIAEEDIAKLSLAERKSMMQDIRSCAVAARELWRHLYDTADRFNKEGNSLEYRRYIMAAKHLADRLEQSDLVLFRNIGLRYQEILKKQGIE